jgi:phosphoribosylamine--glycine ligase
MLTDATPFPLHRPARLAVLASGTGSNLAALLKAFPPGGSEVAEVALVISDRGEAQALERAFKAAVPARHIPFVGGERSRFEAEVEQSCAGAGIDLVVLAGFMRILSGAFAARWRGRLLNIHPSLLPAFPGLHAVRQALAAGVGETGCTVHFVDAGVDTGPVVAQRRLSILPGEGEGSLHERIRALEHQLYPEAIRDVLSGRARFDAGRSVAERARVMVLGSGGREHALALALSRSAAVERVLWAPGNAGEVPKGERLAHLRDLTSDAGMAAVVATALERQVDLVVVGPEAPLAAGLADRLREAGILCYGPSAAAAELEASKAHAKAFMERSGVPTARSRTAATEAEARQGVVELANEAGVVVKASGLAGGKGVTVARSLDEAFAAVAALYAAGPTEVVVEEFLEGFEVSLMLVCDGERALPLPQVEDHKAIGDGDVGPMTGGMGTVAPVERLSEAQLAEVMQRIVEPTLSRLRAEGRPFQGTLFLGLMVDAEGPKLLEYNVRFGDPETQVVLPLLDEDLYLLLRDAAAGSLKRSKVRFREAASCCVVLAAEGYPESPKFGVAIRLPAVLPEGVVIVHAGTELDSAGRLRSSGGRVLGVCATAESLGRARDAAYAALATIEFAAGQYRRDIGARAATAR